MLELLKSGVPLRQGNFLDEEAKMLHLSQFLTSKPILFICNVDENSIKEGNNYSRKVEALAKTLETPTLNISVSMEQELSEISDEEELKDLLRPNLRIRPKPYSLDDPRDIKSVPQKPSDAVLLH